MDVDIFLLILIHCQEFITDELDSILIRHCTCIILKADTQVNVLDLSFEEIFLVEEEDHGSFAEKLRVARLIKYPERVMHAIDLILVHFHVIFTECYNKDHCCDILKAVNPLLSFTSLPSHIHQLEFYPICHKIEFHNAFC